jgi:hypothetical protein
MFVSGKLLFLDQNGMATCIEPERNFKRFVTNEGSGRTLATPSFSNGALYLWADVRLHKIANQ